MYSLISAIAKDVEDDVRWHAVDIGTTRLDVIFKNYSRIVATLSNTFLKEHVAFDLEEIREQYSGSLKTFNEYLTERGNQSLETTTKLPVINTRYAKYADAVRAGYKMRPMVKGLSPDAVAVPEDKTWLHVKKKTSAVFDYGLMYKSVLALVNGFIHATDYDEKAFYVQDGMRSQHISGENQMGFLSFREIGELSFIPITESMIYKQNDKQLYRHQCFVDTDQDITDKTVMLVLGGYLHVLDEDAFYRVSDTSFCINFNKIPLLERYYESNGFIDLSSLGVEVSTANEYHIGINDLFSDRAIKAYLTLSQSFFVLLDNRDVFLDKMPLETAPGPGMYVSPHPPVYPMIAGYGRLVNYWYEHGDGMFAISATHTNVPFYLFDTTRTLKEQSVSNSRVSGASEFHSKAHFLRIGTDL